MNSFIQLDDINGAQRYVNVKHIAFIERADNNCKVVLDIKGREDYANYSFLTQQSYDTVMQLIADSDY